MEFFAAASAGTERALRDELCELGFGRVRMRSGGVEFAGREEDGWRACLESRIAQRVQMTLAIFPAADERELYDGARATDWARYLTPGHTLAVSAFSAASALKNADYAALKAKDAIVDSIRDREGSRPSVSRDDPDVRVFLYVYREEATVYLDLAGDALFQRGYRKDAREAPLKETVAAAILRMAGWDRAMPLVDPMCGSGTIPIEAALWASAIAPGLLRPRFGFERWACHDAARAERMAELRGAARARAHGQCPRIVASDADEAALAVARTNARAAGTRIAFRQARVRDLQPGTPPGLVVANPPYGVRLEADEGLFRELSAAVCRQHGWRVALLAGTPEIPRAIPLQPAQVLPLKNGDIDCRLLIYDVP